MKVYKACVFTVIAVLTLLLSESAIFAWPEISNGVIRGEKADYQITIPESVRNWVLVDRLVLGVDDSMIEGINFYCKAYSNKAQPVNLMRLYVFEKARWDGLSNDAMEVIRVSRDYVFAAEFAKTEGFKQAQDRAFYDYCKTYLGKADSVKNIISLSQYQENLFDSTVFINGKPLDDKAVLMDNVYYVPLRAVFEQMAYAVHWNIWNNSIEVSKEDYGDVFFIRSGKCLGKGFKILIINDRAYISTVYFLRYLDKNVEIDEANNIYMVS